MQRRLRQNLLKLFHTLIVVFCSSLNIYANDQHITIDVKNSSLEKVFSFIEVETGYVFFYDVDVLKNARRVTVSIKNGSLKDVLDIAFKGQSLEYSITNRTIFVKRSSPKIARVA